MKNISLDTFKGIRVLVVGDAMLDRYVRGEVSRISPEAPVPVLSVTERTDVPGGAANVAANLRGLGCSVALWGITGSDGQAGILGSLLEELRVENFLVCDRNRPTTSKTRLVADSQQIVRYDEESNEPVSSELEDRLFLSLESCISGADAVVLSDYGKGLFGKGLARRITDAARREGRPVFIDPKGDKWERYRGADCVTPNERELFQVPGECREKGLSLHGGNLRNSFAFRKLLVTRGAKGMCLFDDEGEYSLPAPRVRDVYDVSGAGDTVVSVLAAAVAAGFSWRDAMALANTAAGVVITKSGTSPVSIEELVSAAKNGRGSKICSRDEAAALGKLWRIRGEKIVFTNGCFDLLHPGHVLLLREAAAEGDRLIVGLNSDESVKKLKGPDRPVLCQEDRAAVLSALDCVDMVVVFPEETPLTLIESLQPDVLVKGGDYTPDSVVGRESVEGRGGRVVIVPLLQGKSTTSILRTVHSGKTSVPEKTAEEKNNS